MLNPPPDLGREVQGCSPQCLVPDPFLCPCSTLQLSAGPRPTHPNYGHFQNLGVPASVVSGPQELASNVWTPRYSDKSASRCPTHSADTRGRGECSSISDPTFPSVSANTSLLRPILKHPNTQCLQTPHLWLVKTQHASVPAAVSTPTSLRQQAMCSPKQAAALSLVT